MIRITGGTYRSRMLETPSSGLTKPTMDKVRAAVFNALGYEIENKKVLDLFSGSGSYGFEALSRNASFVTFVDNQKEAVEIIKKNGASLKENRFETIFSDSLSYLENTKQQFDIVFVDPPYKLDVYQNVLDLLEQNNLLTKDGIIVLESENELDIDENNYKKVKQYNYGLAKIYILRK